MVRKYRFDKYKPLIWSFLPRPVCFAPRELGVVVDASLRMGGRWLWRLRFLLSTGFGLRPPGRGLRPVDCAHFFIERVELVAYGLLAAPQKLGNLAVGVACAHGLQQGQLRRIELGPGWADRVTRVAAVAWVACWRFVFQVHGALRDGLCLVCRRK